MFYVKKKTRTNNSTNHWAQNERELIDKMQWINKNHFIQYLVQRNDQLAYVTYFTSYLSRSLQTAYVHTYTHTHIVYLFFYSEYWISESHRESLFCQFILEFFFLTLFNLTNKKTKIRNLRNEIVFKNMNKITVTVVWKEST